MGRTPLQNLSAWTRAHFTCFFNHFSYRKYPLLLNSADHRPQPYIELLAVVETLSVICIHMRSFIWRSGEPKWKTLIWKHRPISTPNFQTGLASVRIGFLIQRAQAREIQEKKICTHSVSQPIRFMYCYGATDTFRFCPINWTDSSYESKVLTYSKFLNSTHVNSRDGIVPDYTPLLFRRLALLCPL